MITFILTVALILCIYIAYYWKYLILYKKIGGYNPIPLSVPLSLSNKTVLSFSKIYLGRDSKFGFYLVWLGPVPVIVSMCPELSKLVLTDSQCVNKADIYKQLTRFLGPGLLTINNPRWTQIKKILNPAFRQTILQSFFPIFNKQMDFLMKNLEKDLLEKGDTDLLLNIEKCVYDISNETVTGKEGFVQRGDDTHVFEIFIKLPVYLSEKMFKVWYHNDFIYNLTKASKIVDKYIQRFLVRVDNTLAEMKLRDEGHEDEKISDKDDKELMQNNKNPIDLLYDQYKENKISLEEFGANFVQLIAGAFETTSFSLYCILMCLAMYPNYQEKVFQEVCDKFPEKEFQVTFKDLGDLPFLNMFINEVLRLIPGVPCIARKSEGDILFQNEVLIPKGSTFAIDIFNLHRNPKYWGPNAEVFNPYNFLPENIEKLHPYAFIPFSKGNRTCIGERYAQYSLRVMLAKVIRNFKFSTDFKFEDLRFEMDVVLKLQEYPKINVAKRGN